MRHKTFQKLSRREAIGLLGLGGAALLTGTATPLHAKTKLSVPASKKHARIVIAGGGTGGMIAAARIRRAAPNAEIILITPNSRHIYQPGQLYVAAGLAQTDSLLQTTADLLPDRVRWMQDEVKAFDPQSDSVETGKNGKIRYDILIVALGVEYGYDRIEGLEPSMIGKEGIASVYYNDTRRGEAGGGALSQQVFAQLQEEAQKRHVEFLCTEPDTPVKGVGTTLSLLFLGNDRLRRNGANHRVRFTFAKADETLFPSALYRRRLQQEIDRYRNIRMAYGFSLSALDIGKKVAYYDTPDGKKEMGYDFIHIVPPMQAPRVLRDSPLAVKEGVEKGWMDIDAGTLRHPHFSNVFGIGDVLGDTPGKSGGAAQKQGIILQDNIASALEEKPLPYRYNGYTVSPIITREGRILMAEYNAKKVLPTLPLDPMVPRWLWWWVQKDFMPWAYFRLLMHGMM